MTTKVEEFPENKAWDGEGNFKFMGKYHDPRFGDVSVLQNSRNKSKIMLKEKSSGDKKQFHRDISMARQRMMLQNDNLHRMLGWSTVTKKELCSTHHYVRMFFEFPMSDLRNEVAESKKKKNELLSDTTLSVATSNALHGLDYLHVQNLAHGDIRPQLISAEKVGNVSSPNQFKLLDRLSDPSPIERAQINNLMNNKEIFMSPQLYKRINTKGKKKPPYNRQKNDLFALGMSIISAGNAKSVKNCYKKGGDFNKVKLKEHLDTFKQRNANNYSLCNVVTNLVEYEEDVRPDTGMLLGRKQMTVVHQQVIEPEPEIVEEIVNASPPLVYKKVQEEPKRTVIQGDNFFDNPPVTYVETVAPIQPARKSQVIEVKEGVPEIAKTGEKVTIGEPKILRTYVDESSRRSYRGQDRSTLIAPKSPRNQDYNPEEKQAMMIKPENYMNSAPMEEVGTNGRLVRRTVIIKDENGDEIDRYEESLKNKNEP
jgi:serine/threonine protein kinase